MVAKTRYGSKTMPLTLPDHRMHHWQDVLPGLLSAQTTERIDIDCNGWCLTCSDLRTILELLQRDSRHLGHLISDVPQTVVSAKALGLDIQLRSSKDLAERSVGVHPSKADSGPIQRGADMHQGTLRSGDHLHSERDILLLGDVNPGARVSANGNVLIWGRLRGVAHAGFDGATDARIVALQLRPLQLRIADAVARGPDDLPQPGLAEQAILRDGVISIEPAEITPIRRS